MQGNRLEKKRAMIKNFISGNDMIYVPAPGSIICFYQGYQRTETGLHLIEKEKDKYYCSMIKHRELFSQSVQGKYQGISREEVKSIGTKFEKVIIVERIII